MSMTMRHSRIVQARLARGFNLVELLISVVIGMLIVAGGTSLVIAINQSNAVTIESARLTQELRTTMEIIANDLRRARRLDDPINVMGQAALAASNGTTFSGPYDSISNPTSDCILYGYAGTENNSATDATRANPDFRAIYRSVTSGVGAVTLASGTAAVTCTTAGTTLSSNQIDITQLKFDPAPGATPSVAQGLVTITLQGKLRVSGVGNNLGVTRTLTQTVSVRSVKAG